MIPEAAPAQKPSDVPPKGWKEVLKATWKEGGKDNISIVAAGVAFYTFSALVPLLTALVLTYGLVAEPATVTAHMQAITGSLPQGAGDIVAQQMQSMVQTSGGKTGFALLLALLIAIYGASKISTSFMTGMNIAWGVEDKRGFVKRTLIALAMIAGIIVALVAAGFAISAMSLVEDLLPAAGGFVHVLLQVVSLLVAAAIVTLMLAVMYRYAPDRPNAKWAWITPGSILATIVWVIATLGFGFYVSNFGNYNATYGALGAVIVFLTWLYLTAYIILLGAELNAVLEQEVAAQPQANPAESRAAQPATGAAAPQAAAAPAAQKPKHPADAQPPSAGMLALKFGAAAVASKLLGAIGGPRRRSHA